MESISKRKMDKLFAFGTSTVILSYFNDIWQAAKIMSATCSRSRKTWISYLHVFIRNLEPSTKIKLKIEGKHFFDDMNDQDFEWLLSIPIAYFKFNLSIEKGAGITKNIYSNFTLYLQKLYEKLESLSDNRRILYKINNQCKIYINANDSLVEYMKMYRYLDLMQVDDQILDVKFSFCEYDYDEPVYCPYFQTSKLSIKLEGDKDHVERYFVEYITSKNDPDQPFFRKINVFCCDVTINPCLVYFLTRCKTRISNLLLDFKTLQSIIKESEKSDQQLFSEMLSKHIKCIKLCNTVVVKENIQHVINYLLSKLKLETLWISLGSSSSSPDINSFIVYSLLSKQYGITGIQVSKDDGFKFNNQFKESAKDVIMEVAHHTSEGYWKQIIIVEEVKLSTTKIFLKKNSEIVCFITPNRFIFSGIRTYNEHKDKKYANYASVLRNAGEGPNLVNGEYWIKMYSDDAKKLFSDPEHFKTWAKQ